MTSCLQDVIHNSSSKVLTKIVKFTLSSRLHLAMISALYTQKNFLIFYSKIRMTHFDAFSKIESKVTTYIFQKSYKRLFEKKNLFIPIIWCVLGSFEGITAAKCVCFPLKFWNIEYFSFANSPKKVAITLEWKKIIDI